MKRFLTVVVIFGCAVALSAQGGPGSVGAIGQSVPRVAAPTGPTPHFPDGTVDLSGVWVGGGSVNDIERDGGLPAGTLMSIMTPSAKALFSTRKEEQNPHYACMPMAIPRTTPYPFRLVQLQIGRAHV